jgi:glutamine synthetase
MATEDKKAQILAAGELLKKNNIDSVRVGCVDLDGIWRGKQFGLEYFMANVAANGTNIANVLVGWDSADEVLDGLKYTNWDRGFPDFKLLPDLETLRLNPWDPRTASVICDINELDGSPMALSPRGILKAAVAKAESMGYKPKAAYEFEFYLFEGTAHDLAANAWRDVSAMRGSGHCYSMSHHAGSEAILGQFRRYMRDAGVEIEATISEHGPGQYEINLKYSDAVSAADTAVLPKVRSKTSRPEWGDGLLHTSRMRHGRVFGPHAHEPFEPEWRAAVRECQGSGYAYGSGLVLPCGDEGILTRAVGDLSAEHQLLQADQW